MRAERVRQQLKVRPKFDMSQAFKAIDAKSKAEILKNNFAEYLEERHYFATEKELGYLMLRFDKDQDGAVNYSEFVQELTPRILVRV
jgi:Ca2+-binding EF-hand superfamily protein